MNAKKIIYATDFSPDSQVACEYASSLAASTGATLCIVHADDVTPGLVFGNVGYGYVPQVDEIAREQYEQLLAITPTVPRVEFEHRFFRGDPAESILKLAEAENADMIVIGTHGKTGIKRLIMGSVAEAVVRRAKCPVLTIKQPGNSSGPTSMSEESSSLP